MLANVENFQKQLNFISMQEVVLNRNLFSRGREGIGDRQTQNALDPRGCSRAKLCVCLSHVGTLFIESLEAECIEKEIF